MTTKRRARKRVAYTYVLRTCDARGNAYRGFRWPEKGPVTCPDWNPTPECGGGLHGFLHGIGNGELADWSPDARWLVVKVRADEVVVIDSQKVKVPRGVVVYSGDRLTATALIRQLDPEARAGAVIGAVVSSGDWGTSTSGDGGTSTSGNGGTSTSGDWGTSTSGNGGTSTSGDRGTIVIKHWDGIRYRLVVGYIGENGLLPNTPYRLNNKGAFVRADQ